MERGMKEGHREKWANATFVLFSMSTTCSASQPTLPKKKKKAVKKIWPR